MLAFRRHVLRQAITKLPILGSVAKQIYRTVVLHSPPDMQFKSSPQYWEDRYAIGGNSGSGSYGRLAKFKADVINDFVNKNAIQTVIEFGCGDGAQLQLARYPHYVGFDISDRAVEICRSKFSEDPTKRFFHATSHEADILTADLTMSLDVIYHLVEDEIYDAYMRRLVAAAKKFICIYSSNFELATDLHHIRHRRFVDWLAAHTPHCKLHCKIANPYPEDPNRPNDTSWADFYFFEV